MKTQHKAYDLCAMVKSAGELSKERPRPRLFICELRRVLDPHVLLHLWLGGSEQASYFLPSLDNYLVK